MASPSIPTTTKIPTTTPPPQTPRPQPTPPTQINDYTILPLQLPVLPSYPQNQTHYTYIRPHDPSVPTLTTPRSLFLANIPIDATIPHFRALFADERLGGARVADVEFEEARGARMGGRRSVVGGASGVRAPGQRKTKEQSRKRKRKGGVGAESGAEEEDDDDSIPTNLPALWDRTLHSSGSSAVVIFADRASMELAMRGVRRAVRKGIEVVWGAGVRDGEVPALGSQRYLTNHTLHYPASPSLHNLLETFTTAHAARERHLAAHRRQTISTPDADGFTTVTRGSRTGPARLEEANEVLRKQEERERAKREGMGDFYRFQGRERRRERERELVRRFEGDRRVVEGLRREKRGVFVPG